MPPSEENSASERAGTDEVTEASQSASEFLTRARPEPPASAALARASVLGAMFGADSASGAVGRFRVLGRLGAGGMGVVYEAYDPDLARGVALKLVNVAARNRDAALVEAKALARLSHPNVVPIYDVGLDRDRIYLVMELVRGQTLRRWTEGRALREVIAVYQQAGRALAAAHAVGLVHRDFKPDNAIVGGDGRVRVVDFGLACEADDPARAAREHPRAAGTPGYMAPEIRAGTAITPAADQYSFCVALGEAIERSGKPVPRWIAAALERGRTADPAQRFASMTALLQVLARDPARTRRRIGMIGGLATAVGALAFLLGWQASGKTPASCDAGAARLDAAWSPWARAAALERLAALGPDSRLLRALIEPALDDHRARWLREDRAACLDRRGGAESDTLSDRRTVCLRRGIDDLAAVGELLAGAKAADLVAIPRAVQTMHDPTACSDLAALTSDIEPPPPAQVAPLAEVRRQIARAEIQLGGGRYDRALAVVGEAVADARRLAYKPVLAEALLVQGHAQMNLDRRSAVPILVEAMRVANWSRAGALAVEASARLVFARGTSTDPDGAFAGIDFVESFAQPTPVAQFALALLYNNLGSVALGRGDLDVARDYLQRALATSHGLHGRGALELVGIRANLGLATADRTQGDQLVRAAATELAERLGEDHPDTVALRVIRGFATTDDLAQAEALLAPACRAYDRGAVLDADAAECWTEVGLLRWDLGSCATAAEAMASAAAHGRPAPEAVAYAALLGETPQAAAQQFAELVRARPAEHEADWDRATRGALMLGLGRARAASGDLGAARPMFEAAIAELEPFVRKHPGARYERYLGRARVDLANALLEEGTEPAACADAAAAATAWLRRVGGPDWKITYLTTPPVPRRRTPPAAVRPALLSGTAPAWASWTCHRTR